ncbi:GNAT family N-acetyltransferase [Chitinimonas sp. BJB300]|uniref:GNAT family N-acetyltransferase n=1 Tax=Chitinimonas sp. BJB300 TaxID=1559339 RepID=UPI000C0E3ADC|nr:GNAT family protein [Chitinimonas sp. BJB300]PHV12647.1 hypothetical protein CSQ89_04630 [Chitinimonas sp. BJB300]TSJ91181.1 GNAT family N-acetyltransferase [Chitinimonas sp. BJB300]
MGEIQFRPATPEDADNLSAFFFSVFTEPNAWIPLTESECPGQTALAKQLTASATENNSYWMLAYAGEHIVGSCKLRGGQLEANQHIVTLDLHIAASLRGQGVGRRLLQAAMDWVRVHPIVNRIELECFAANVAAIALYTSSGFFSEGHRKARYRLRGMLHDTLHMSWLASPTACDSLP